MANSDATLKALNAERQFADGVAEKLRKARAAEAMASERYDTLAGQSELPPGIGLVIGPDALTKARRDRDDKRDEVGRLEAVLRASERRIAEAAQAHEAALERDAFVEAKRLVALIAQAEEQAVEHASKASAATAQRLKLRRRLTEISPAFKRLHPLANVNIVEAQGHDRALALMHTLVGRFHGPAVPEEKHLADVEQLRAAERAFVEALATANMGDGGSMTEKAA